MLSFLILASALATSAAPSVPLDTRALIEQALEEPTEITLKKIELRDAIRKITEQTGVRIAMSDSVMALAPYGGATVIREVEIANVPLREGLDRLFGPLGMTFVVRRDRVEILPKEGIRNLGRAPTWVELDLLLRLAGSEPGLRPEDLAKLRGLLQFQVTVQDAWAILSDAIHRVGAGPGDEVLTIACENLGWGWQVSDDRIVITPLERKIQRLLQTPISLRMNHRPLFDVLTAIGDAAGVKVSAEPGALTSLPAAIQRNFSVNVHRQTAEQVLETISAYTGLGYLIEPDGVLFYRAGGDGDAESTAANARFAVDSPDPYVAKMPVRLEDGRTVEWLIRRSELPEDLQRMRAQDITELIEALRRRPPDRGP